MSEPRQTPPHATNPELVVNGNGGHFESSASDQHHHLHAQHHQQQSMEDTDYDKCRIDYVDEIAHLEAEFTRLKAHLFDDRLAFLRAKEQEVLEGRAPEYLEPLAQLTENCRIRLQVAKLTRQLRYRSARHALDCELQWALSQHEWDRQMLEERLRSQISQQISAHQQQQLHNSHHQHHHHHHHHQQQHLAQSNHDGGHSQHHQKSQQPEAPKPLVAVGPVIIYQLTETEILEDCAMIMRSCVAGLGLVHG